jgi:transcriptional regulator with XRE-family HTH domain
VTGRTSVSSGVVDLDRLLGGLFIGDNVVWYDDSGNLASTFCLNLVKTSLAHEKQVIYVCFDRSPKNLLDKLGILAENSNLTILDGFTAGKGARSSVFMRFYEEPYLERTCPIQMLKDPGDVDHFQQALYSLLETMEGDVRLVFESITGMQELWGGEEAIVKFYAHSCPRLYELETIAYWIMEKLAHSQRLRAQINQIAQVAISLAIKRGTTTLTILKAKNRGTQDIDTPHRYWTKDLDVSFGTERRGAGQLNLGLRVKQLRTKRGLSQSELAKLVGVTPSTISQVETNTIHPSIPALLKMAEVLSVSIGAIFQQAMEVEKRFIFSQREAIPFKFPDLPASSVEGSLLTPSDFQGKVEPNLIEIMPKAELPAHFFTHKGEEMGYLISGKLQVFLNNASYDARAGDTIYLTSEVPTQWRNPGPGVAKLLWIKVG